MTKLTQEQAKGIPEFNLEYSKGKINITENKNNNSISIGYTEIMGSLRASGNLYIPKDQFEKFVAGCAEILSWLKEQK
jgi:hypothetical protein